MTSVNPWSTNAGSFPFTVPPVTVLALAEIVVPGGFNNSNLGIIKEKGILYVDLASGPPPFPKVLIFNGNLVDASVGSHWAELLLRPSAAGFILTW